MNASSTLPTALLVVFFGCSGGTTGGGTEPGNGSSSLGPSAVQRVTKLTPAEYASAVSDLLGIVPSAQPAAMSGVSTASGFASATAAADDMALSYYDSAFAIATLATSAAHMRTLLQGAACVAPSGNSGSAGAACAAAFIDALAPLAFRNGPVDAATLAGLKGVYTAVAVTQGGGFSSGVAAVIEEVLQSPYFL
jgi:hypothetical protein